MDVSLAGHYRILRAVANWSSTSARNGSDRTRPGYWILVNDLGLNLVEEGTPGKVSWSIDGATSRSGAFLPNLGTRSVIELVAAAGAIRLMYPRLSSRSPWSAKPARRWDNTTTQAWVHRMVRTPAGRAVTEVYVRGNSATELGETSIYGILAGIRGCGSLRNIWRAEKFRISEGAFEIPRRLSVPLRERIRFDSPVRAISQDSEGVTVSTDADTVRGRRAVVCVPHVLSTEIRFDPPLPPRKAALIANAPMGACIKFFALYDRPFWRSANLNGQILSADHAVSLTYDNSPRDGSAAGGIVGFVLANQARRVSSLSRAEQEAEILGSLEHFFGRSAAQPSTLEVQDWNREPWSRGAYAAHYPVGVLTMAGSALQDPHGRVHWAGADTSTEWLGYMEGAIRSADRVVQEIMARPDWRAVND